MSIAMTTEVTTESTEASTAMTTESTAMTTESTEVTTEPQVVQTTPLLYRPPPTHGSRILTQVCAMQSLWALTPEALGPPICKYHVHVMETFANPDVWIARDSVLGTMVSHTLERSADSTLPDFLCDDRQLLRDIRDSPTRVSTIRLQWAAGSQRLFEYDWTAPHRVDPSESYDALVITVNPKKVAHANYLGHMTQWRNNAKFTNSEVMPHLRVGWLKYIYYCIMMWSGAPIRPKALLEPSA